MSNHLKIALFNAGKYRRIDLALSASRQQKYWVPVLMGENGIYLVPSTNREAGMLQRAGYEAVE
jgi:hypothetical protein